MVAESGLSAQHVEQHIPWRVTAAGRDAVPCEHAVHAPGTTQVKAAVHVTGMFYAALPSQGIGLRFSSWLFGPVNYGLVGIYMGNITTYKR